MRSSNKQPVAAANNTAPTSKAHTTPKKVVNISVTILSISGVSIKEDGKKKKKKDSAGGDSVGWKKRGISPSRAFPSRSLSPRRNNKKQQQQQSSGNGNNFAAATPLSSNDDSNNAKAKAAATKIVASFSRNVQSKQPGGKDKTIMTHVPSLPLKLDDNDNDDDSGGKIFWAPTKQLEEDQLNISSQGAFHYQFQQIIQEEEEDTTQQELPTIQVAISRPSGRMFKLGTATIPHTLLLSSNSSSSSSSSATNGIIHTLPIVINHKDSPKKKKKSKKKKKDDECIVMKLKGDTIKCSLFTNHTTLTILLHVTHPIGERIVISRSVHVTAISNSMLAKHYRRDDDGKEKKKKEEEEEGNPRGKELQVNLNDLGGVVGDRGQLLVVAAPVGAIDATAASIEYPEDERPSKVLPSAHPEDEEHVVVPQDKQDVAQVDKEGRTNNDDVDDKDNDDEPSCSSSAYMSDDDDIMYPHNKNAYSNSMKSRSYSTATTDISGYSTTSSYGGSIMSDLTSVMSQTGIEVVPTASGGNGGGAAASSSDGKVQDSMWDANEWQIQTIHHGHNDKDEEDGGYYNDEQDEARQYHATATMPSRPHRARRGNGSTTIETNAQKKKQTWRQRLACGGLPPVLCGEEGCNDNDNDDYNTYDDDLSSAVNEEEEDMLPRSRYSKLVNLAQCNNIIIQPNISYYTEYTYEEDDDDESFVEEDGDDGASSVDGTSRMGDKRYSGLEQALFG